MGFLPALDQLLKKSGSTMTKYVVTFTSPIPPKAPSTVTFVATIETGLAPTTKY
jgi:hypothetical protein